MLNERCKRRKQNRWFWWIKKQGKITVQKIFKNVFILLLNHKKAFKQEKDTNNNTVLQYKGTGNNLLLKAALCQMDGWNWSWWSVRYCQYEVEGQHTSTRRMYVWMRPCEAASYFKKLDTNKSHNCSSRIRKSCLTHKMKEKKEIKRSKKKSQ